MVDPRGVGEETPACQDVKGLVILGALVGQVEFVKAQYSVLLQRIPLVENLEAAWLFISFCAAARANFMKHLPRAMTTACGRVWF